MLFMPAVPAYEAQEQVEEDEGEAKRRVDRLYLVVMADTTADARTAGEG